MDTIYVKGVNVPIGTHEGKRIVIGSYHRGFEYKRSLVEFLAGEGYSIKDVGTNSQERCDYPLFSGKIGSEVSAAENFSTVGIGICGSGIGILIPASMYRGVYAARCLTTEEAAESRRHNNSNVLGIGADAISLESALAVVKTWLETPFFMDRKKEIAYLLRYVQTVRLEDGLIRT